MTVPIGLPAQASPNPTPAVPFPRVFLVFGFRTRATRVGGGVFFCPNCRVDRQYELLQLRRWFTLFFIPIFPTGAARGQHVKCQTCGKAYQPQVLEAPTSQSLAAALVQALRLAVVALLRVTDPADTTAREAAVRELVAAGAAGYGPDALLADLAALDPSGLVPAVQTLARGLNQHGKEGFVSRLARIGAGGGALTEAQTAVIEAVGSSLGLSVAHLAGIVALATDPTRRPQP